MPPRLPTPADFPPSTILSITPPPAGGKPVNILLLLHGLGDTYTSMKLLGERMSLPETICISIQAPTPLPFDIGGSHWGDNLIFDAAGEGIDSDAGFAKAVRLMRDVIAGLREKCGYRDRDLVFFGFGQGGMVALKVVLEIAAAGEEFGGVVSIGGPLPSDVDSSKKQKCSTPVIVLGGSSESSITEAEVERLKKRFAFVEYKKWRRPGDGAPRNRDEMLPIMQFFARRLQSRHGVPEGSVELT